MFSLHRFITLLQQPRNNSVSQVLILVNRIETIEGQNDHRHPHLYSLFIVDTLHICEPTRGKGHNLKKK